MNANLKVIVKFQNLGGTMMECLNSKKILCFQIPQVPKANDAMTMPMQM